MPTTIVFDFGEVTVRARLLEETAPLLCRTVVKHLPVRSFAVHAKFAGEELITMVPFYADPENEVLDVKAGDIGYYPGRQTFCLFYGRVVPFGKVSVFGSVTDSMEKLRPLGARALEKGWLPLMIRLEDEESRRPFSPSTETKSAPGQEHFAWIEGFKRSVWEDAPDDIERLKSTARPPMGSLPCIFYACFNLFWLGEELQVCRQMARNQSLPLECIKRMMIDLLSRHAGRLEKWGMRDTCEFLIRLADQFSNQVLSDEEYLSGVEQALITINKLQSWVDSVIPWPLLDSSFSTRLR